MRRVVITGLGLVTPVGTGVDHAWSAILSGQNGAGKISAFDASDLGCQIACEVPRVDGRGGGSADMPGAFNPDDTMAPKDQRKVDTFIQYAVAAATEAVEDSGWVVDSDDDQFRTGVMIGSGIGGLSAIADTAVMMEEKGPRRVSPFFIPSALINLASGHVSIKYGFKGPNHSVVTACATGAHAIGDAFRLIKHGDADVMVAGGAEAAICRIGIAGFVACRALSTAYNDTPEKGSRPYDKGRDGFVMGEGAGVVVLEEYEHAKARGAKIYGEVIGYGLSGDAHHITAPADDGDGGYRAMKAALSEAKMKPADIGYVNAHGTSTPLGDEIELRAVERLFGDAADGLVMSSTKSAVGHLLGAAGAIEAVFSTLVLRDQKAPPTINLDDPSVETKIDLVPHTAKNVTANAVMSNSFGFGGTNATLIFKAAE